MDEIPQHQNPLNDPHPNLDEGAAAPVTQRLSITATLRDGSVRELPAEDLPDAVWKIGAALLRHKVEGWTLLRIEISPTEAD